jgi:hypothetical protein
MSKKTYIAYQITETGKSHDNGDPISYWNRVGMAWVNKDGSINVQLNSLPLDGKIQLREPKEGDKE